MHSPPLAQPLRNDRLVITVAGAATVLAVSLFYTPLPLVLVLACAAGVYFITRPYELLLVMVFLIPFNFVFRVGPVPVAAELLKVFAWAPFVITRSRRPVFLGSRYNQWFLLWAGIIALSLARSSDFPYSLKECVRLGSNIGLVYLVLNLVDSRDKVLQVFRVLTLSTCVVAVYGFYQFAVQDFGPLFWIVNPRMDTSLAHGRFTFWEWRGRIISVLTSEMELGHYFNLSLPLAVVLWLREARRQWTSKWLWMALAILAGLALTFTFGAWISLITATGFLALILDRKRRWKIALTAAPVFSLLAALLTFGPLRSFLMDKVSGREIGSLAWDVFTRLDAWAFALQTWLTHPWLGVGVGNYELLEYSHEFIHSPWGPSGSTPHETYLYLLAVSGVVGLAGMLFIFLGCIRSNLRLRFDRHYGLIALGLAFALIANLVGWLGDDSTFLGPHTSYLLWLVVGLTEAVRVLAARQSPDLAAA